jgi:hypothetical protein
VTPDIYSKTMPIITGDHDIDLVWFGSYHVLMRQDQSITHLGYSKKDIPDGKHVMTYNVWKQAATVWNKIFKANIIRDHEIIFSEVFLIGEDNNFNWKYMTHTRFFYHLSEPLTFYFINHEGHISLTKKIHREEELTVALQPLFLLEAFAEYLCGKNLLDKHKGFIADSLSAEKYMKGYKSSLRHEYFKKARQIAVQYDLPNTPDNFIKKLKSGDRNPAGLYFWVRRIFVKKKDAKQAIFYLFGCKILSVPIR